MAASVSTRTLTIILATVLPCVFLTTVVVVLLCCRNRRRKAQLFRRGITPIADEEIESWKVDRRTSEKPSESGDESTAKDQGAQGSSHKHGASIGSIQKPPSIIVYQSPFQHHRQASDGPSAVRPASERQSTDLPTTPILARAPNSRPGLTDEAVQGDDAFVSQPKRQASRLAKQPPTTPPGHGRSKSTRSTISPRTVWNGQELESQSMPRRSVDTSLPSVPLEYRTKKDRLSSRSNPDKTASDEEIFLGGLSPRPLIHKSEIGRAIG